MVEAIVGLSRALDLSVVGEGVETEADALADLGVRWFQGFLLGRPMPAERAEAYLAERWASNAA